LKISMNKSRNALIALLLVLTFAVSLIALPAANAHTPAWTLSTYAFINVSPNPVGVDQTVYISFWIDKVPPTAVFNYGYHWHDMTVTVTKPNGDTQTLQMPDSDAVGGTWAPYVVDQVGTYKFVGTFPTQVPVIENPYPGGAGFISTGIDFINDTYTGSTSKEVTVTVQQEQITTAYPAAPLPTGYWQRPINSMNRDWSSIGGNWLGLAATTFGDTGLYNQNGNFNPYTTAPNSAHVLWTKPEAFGGQIGGEFGPDETSLYATGTAYETKFSPVILYGILYYTAYPGAKNNPGPLTAVDLRTGKTLWTKDVAAPLLAGMIYKFNTGDQYGAHAYLFTAPSGVNGWVVPFIPNVWSMYDAMTGDWILDIANVSSSGLFGAGQLVRGPNGEILSYSAGGGNLALWNISKAIEVGSQKNNFYIIYSAAEIWRPPQGATIDGNDGYEWVVPTATNISGVPIDGGLSVSKISDDVVLLTASPGGGLTGVPGGSQPGFRIDAGYSAVDGHLLWGPINRTLTPWTNVPLGPAGEGVYTEYTNQFMTWTGYDIKTGTKLWGPTAPKNSSWGYYDFSSPSVIGYGNLYTWGLSGEVYAYDVKTGELNWSWYAGSAGVDSPYGSWPLGTFGGYDLADGKLYVAAGHDYTPPVFKGAKMYAINATTGELIWSSLMFSMASSPAVADGILVKLNGYDNQIYAYGKGPSATTVEAPLTAITQGDSVVIRGTVTDQSPSTMEYAQTARFPNGVPAIADEDMSAWMEYLYQQQPMPTDATGVTVKLETLDPNGNFYEIGTTTSDASGMYKLLWQPPVPGEYTIIATFQGSESYYSSYAETALGVTAAPEATPGPTPPPASMTDTYVIGFGSALIVVVAIGFALLLLRKR
jgi:outer membrane protein assembly factor BamB